MTELREDDPLRRGFMSLGEGAPTKEDCPSPEVIWEASSGRSDAESFQRLVEHNASCPACAEEWRLARGIKVVAGDERYARPMVSAGGWLAAAAVLLMLGVGAYLLNRTGGEQMRSGSSLVIHSFLPEEAPLRREECVLRWTAGPEGTVYGIRVLTEDAEEIAAADNLSENEYHLQEDALRAVDSGERIYWRVQARLPDGSESDSTTFINRIR